jgi:hypothetical protein
MVIEKKPFTMTILGKPYKVDFANEFDLIGNIGAANRGLQAIRISDTLADEQVEDTLLHEVLHIIDKELAIGLEEADVARLAVGLHSAGYRYDGGHYEQR